MPRYDIHIELEASNLSDAWRMLYDMPTSFVPIDSWDGFRTFGIGEQGSDKSIYVTFVDEDENEEK